jgi:hypothetical protein
MDLRNEAKQEGNSILDSFLKMCYSAFVGKTISSNQNHVDLKFATSRAFALRYASNHRFNDWKPISKKNDISLFSFSKGTVHYDMPSLIGFTVLELSKLKLYETFDEFKLGFPGAKIIHGNTDSLALLLPTADVCFLTRLKSMSYLMDFSNLDPSHTLYSCEGKGIPGRFKLIHPDICEIISLGASTNSYLPACAQCKAAFTPECDECREIISSGKHHKLSGCPKTISKRISHLVYRKYITDNKPIIIEQELASEPRPIFTKQQQQTRKIFSKLKRTRHFHGNESVPLGHWRTIFPYILVSWMAFIVAQLTVYLYTIC